MTNYPENVTLKDFTRYLALPVLVYDLEYPIKKERDYLAIARTLFNFFFGLTACYVIDTEYIIPTLALGNALSFWQLVAKLTLPVTLFLLFIVYIIFEAFTNLFGEITGFADREFYKEWWNSTTFELFNRLWNRPVHEFLFRHVYL